MGMYELSFAKYPFNLVIKCNNGQKAFMLCWMVFIMSATILQKKSCVPLTKNTTSSILTPSLLI